MMRRPCRRDPAPRVRLTVTWPVLPAVFGALLFWFAGTVASGPPTAAADQTPSLAAVDAQADAPALAAPQEENDSTAAADDQRLPVQLWTVLAAGGAMAVGLVLYLLRIAMGRVAPPPPPPEEDQH